MANYGSLIVGIRADTSGLSRQIRSDMGRVGDEAGQTLGSRISGGLKTFGKAAGVAGLALGAVGFAKATAFAKNAVIDFNSTLEQARIGFTTMLGSGQKADKFLRDLQAFAARTPFEFAGLTQQAQTMMGMGVAARDVLPDLTAIGDSVASVGGDQEVLNRTVLAFSQIMARGKLDMGNMNQLLQSGMPNALKILSNSMHISTGDLTDMISKGKVMASDALPLLVKGIERGTTAFDKSGQSTAALSGMMDKQSRTFAGALSNISDSLTQSLAKIGRPLFTSISGWTNRLAGFLGGRQFTQIGQTVTRTLGTAFANIGPAIGALGKAIVPLLQPIGTFVKLVGTLLFRAFQSVWPFLKVAGGASIAAALWVIRTAFDSVNAILGPIVGWFSNPIFRTIAGSLAAIAAAWWLVNAAMAANPFVLFAYAVIAAIAAIVIGIGQLIKHWHTIWGAISRVASSVWTNGIKPVLSAFAGFFTRTLPRAFFTVWHAINNVWRRVWRFLKTWGPVALAVLAPFIGIPLLIWQHFGKITGWLGRVWRSVVSGVKSTLWQRGVKPVFDALTSVPGKIAAAFRGLVGTLRTVWDKIKSIVAVPARFAAFSIINPLLKGANFLLSKIGLSIPLIPKFAEGGKVPGTGNRDTQPALLTPGEWVLTKRQAAGIGYGNLRNLPRYQEGGPVGFEPTWWGSDILGSIGRGVMSGIKGLAHMGAEVWDKASGLFRYAAAKAFEGLTLPLAHLAERMAGQQVPPHLFQHALGSLMLDAIKKTVAFIWGKSETSPEVAGVAGEIAAKAVEVATRQLGKPYVFSAHGPNSFDCSGLMEYSYRMAGYPDGKVHPNTQLPSWGTTYTQVQKGKKVNSAIPGDLVFYFGGQGPQPHHVAMATSGTDVIHAPDVGMNVMRSSQASAGMSGDRRLIRRVVEATAGTADLGNVAANALGIFTALKQIGWNSAQAAGALGNMLYESNFNPYIVQGGGISRDPRDAGSGGYGLVQWTPGAKLANILAWGHKQNTLGNQLWALNEQLHGRSPYPEGRAGKLLFGVRRNAYRAGLIFGNEYERFSTDTSAGRAASARAFYERLARGGRFDNGGWVMPGVNLTENLTRKPEPVLTNQQWADISAAAANNQRGGGTHHIVGGSLDIAPDSQGRLRAWVQDVILEEADYASMNHRMGGGSW